MLRNLLAVPKHKTCGNHSEENRLEVLSATPPWFGGGGGGGLRPFGLQLLTGKAGEKKKKKPGKKKKKKRKREKIRKERKRQKCLSEVCWCGVSHRRLTAAAPSGLAA